MLNTPIPSIVPKILSQNILRTLAQKQTNHSKKKTANFLEYYQNMTAKTNDSKPYHPIKHEESIQSQA